jgi:hypothetical protein
MILRRFVNMKSCGSRAAGFFTGRPAWSAIGHVTFVEFAGEFERSLHTKGGAGGRTSVPKHKPTGHNVR